MAQQLFVASPIATRLWSIIPTVLAPFLSITATFLATLATILSDRLPISKIPVAKRRKKRKAQQLLVASPIAARLLSVIPTVLAPFLSITATFLATLAAILSDRLPISKIPVAKRRKNRKA
jgi:energy-converting hydrogenase Eha subunit C